MRHQHGLVALKTASLEFFVLPKLIAYLNALSNPRAIRSTHAPLGELRTLAAGLHERFSNSLPLAIWVCQTSVRYAVEQAANTMVYWL